MSDLSHLKIGSLTDAVRTYRNNDKGETKLQRVIAKQRTEKQSASAFKAAVWARDKGQCRVCKRKVIRSLAVSPKRGEVHHLRGRNVAPKDRFNPEAAALLCAVCHAKAQRHEIKIPKLPVGTP